MPKRQRQARQQVVQNTYRFFVSADTLHGRELTLEDQELAHQFGNVLRLKPGARVLLLDNTGWQYTVELTRLERGVVAGVVERKELAQGEPHTKLTLYIALLRPERFEWVLQKGTELGVSAFVPLISERSTIADANELSERKLERWNRIIREAAEQACRGKLPRLAAPLFFPMACEQAVRRSSALLLWEGGEVPSLKRALHSAPTPTTDTDASQAHPFSVAIFSGPEGGFTRNELETARGYGIIPVTLGPRILRAETAPLVAATAVLYEMDDLE